MSDYQSFQSKVETVERTFDFKDHSSDSDSYDHHCFCCRRKIRSDETSLLDKLQTCDLCLNIMNRIFVWLTYLILAAAAALFFLYFLSGVFVSIID
jgi:hypothetical protein